MIFSLKFILKQPNTININQIKNIANKFNAKIQKEDIYYAFYIENPNEQLLQDFGNYLSYELSNSVFLRDIKAEYVDAIPNGAATESINDISTPCKDCISKLQNNEVQNECKICNSAVDTETLNLKVYEKIFSYKENSQELIEKFSQLIVNGAVVQTNHNMNYFSVTRDNFLNNTDRVFVCKDINTIYKYFTLNEQELKMLASVERPIINLSAKEIFVIESKLPIATANIRLPNSQIEYLLFKKLEESNIDIICTSSFKIDSKIILNSNTIYKSTKMAFSKNSKDFYIHIDNANAKQKNTIVFNIFKKEKSSVVIYTQSDKIELLTLDFNFSNFIQIFEYIEQMDEKGKILIENFKTKMPTKYEQLLKSKIKNTNNNLEDGFLFINALLSDQNGLDIYENACNYKGTSGGKLDFRVDSKSNVSLIWTIRTVISYLLAGASSSSIACAVFESLADFFTQILERYQKEYGIESVVFNGSMFEEKILFQKCHELISKNYTII